MYGLPKIHKLQSPIVYSADLNCKARPIISACGCATEAISHFVDTHIQPLAQSVPSYLKDTTDFLRRLSAFDNVPEGSILVTADVSSLYPSIPTDAGLAALRSILEEREIQMPTTEGLVRLAEIVLRYNHFTFNGKFYTQISGTAMGTRFAPSYAIIFMHFFENELLSTAPNRPLCWFRFIDDIFFIWTHGIVALQEFMDHCNSQNPSIVLNFEQSENSVSFLDVLVSIRAGRIRTNLFRKPTDTLHYLDFQSCHPTSHKLPIAYSQALRIRKICSDNRDAKEHCRELLLALVRRGYPRHLCSNRIAKAMSVDRETLIWPVEGPRNKDPLRMVLPFHPDVQHIPDIITRHMPLLGDANLDVKVYWKPPTRLRSFLVSSSLKPVPTDRKTGPIEKSGMTSCERPRCLTCNMILKQNRVSSSKTNLSYKLPKSNCKSSNVIYLLTFRNCTQQYVGQTSQELSKRMNLYRSTYNHKKADQPVVHHMIEHEHAWEDLKVTVLEHTTRDNLNKAELFWISQMMTDAPFGLNIQHVLYRNVFAVDNPNL